MNESESAGPPLNRDMPEGEPALLPSPPGAAGSGNDTPAYARPAANGDPSQIVEADGTSALELPDIVRALRHRDFRWFWAGNFVSNIGTWMQNVAQGWLVFHLTNSAFWLGLIGFASTIPILFFALIGGVIADHVNNRKLLMVTQSTMMVSAFMMSVLAFAKVIRPYEIVLLALLTGLAMALNTPS